MDEKEQRMDEDRDDQKSGRPVQLDKDKVGQQQGGEQQHGGGQHQGGQQGGGPPQPQQGGQQQPAGRPMPEEHRK